MAVTGTYHHVHLISHDPDAAADWYVRALGGQVQKRAEVKGARNVQLKVGVLHPGGCGPARAS